ncbi:DNA (cytosine-5)-methyltransferase 1 [Amycolatopsis pretoriensis]|uniref:Cytosine-specific methyltransferase n=1 Tax=Amycolatopsis pretoriensis TaxID=218821 RepID=A0A1H5RA24_9PSEU|nr:DNA (cytosine-5)-methyltransferase 1 [Amycolatopsis pretoriensis]
MTGYGAELTAAWAAHTAPREPDAPTVASLFAGCGGSSLGYSMAGFRELLAVERDPHAVAMFRRNFPDVAVYHGDVTELDPAALPLAPGELDVLDGSPPCQGFSRAGKFTARDTRNDLFRHFVRLLSAWQPRMFVMENVADMIRTRMRVRFAEVLAALRTAGPGYRVTARVLDSSWLRVPQSRSRMIFIGVRSDLDAEPTHPTPVSRPLTVRHAWADLDNPGLIVRPTGKFVALAPMIGPGENGAKALRAAGRKPAQFNLYRLSWHRPAPALPSLFGTSWAGFLHPAEDRFIGSREMTRLQSFPDEYDWGDSAYKLIHARVGNSVPPLMMRAVATAVRSTLDQTRTGPVVGQGGAPCPAPRPHAPAG